jgi:hypothetical protein
MVMLGGTATDPEQLPAKPVPAPGGEHAGERIDPTAFTFWRRQQCGGGQAAVVNGQPGVRGRVADYAAGEPGPDRVRAEFKSGQSQLSSSSRPPD